MDEVLVSERGSDEVFATVAMVRVDLAAARRASGSPATRCRCSSTATGVRPGPAQATGVALGIVDGVVWAGVDGTGAARSDGRCCSPTA